MTMSKFQLPLMEWELFSLQLDFQWNKCQEMILWSIHIHFRILLDQLYSYFVRLLIEMTQVWNWKLLSLKLLIYLDQFPVLSHGKRGCRLDQKYYIPSFKSFDWRKKWPQYPWPGWIRMEVSMCPIVRATKRKEEGVDIEIKDVKRNILLEEDTDILMLVKDTLVPTLLSLCLIK